MTMRRAKEIASAFTLVLIGVIYLGTDSRYSWGRLANPGPGFFPAVIGALFLMGAAVFCVSSFTSNENSGSNGALELSPEQSGGSRKPWLLLVLLAAYLLTVDQIGYLIDSPLLMLSSARLMGLRSWWRSLLLAVGATLATYLVFGVWLQVPLPKVRFLEGG